MLDLTLLALCSVAICVVAGMAQAVSGFGGAMVAVPLLALVVDPVTAVVAATGLGLAISGPAWVRERQHVATGTARRLSVAGVLGMPAGLAVLLVADARTLGTVIGLVLALTVLALALRWSPPSGVPSQWGAGAASGALLTSTGMNGPPLVLCLHGSGAPPRRIRATLQAVFTVQDVAALVAFAVAGAVTGDALVVVATGWVGVRLGWALGDRIFHLLSPEAFRGAVLVGLAAAAVLSLAQSVHA